MDIGTLKKYVTRGWIEWRKHVFQRMLERGVSKSDVKKVLLEGELINSYDYDQPFPSALFFKKVNNRPLMLLPRWTIIIERFILLRRMSRRWICLKATIKQGENYEERCMSDVRRT